jgi:3-oxoacyl-[acyl-carrier protein] reductase
MHLTDRVVLLTGARRIGASVAAAVAERGADVAITYNRSHEDADETAAAVTALQ